MNLNERVIAIKSGGEMASAIVWRLHHARMRRIVILETKHPLAVRRTVSFCEAVHDGSCMVEDVRGVRIDGPEQIEAAWAAGDVPILVDPEWRSLDAIRPDVLVDAIIAKRNLGTSVRDAPLVIGLGPGFEAGQDAHLVVETNRGHDLGRIITEGMAAPNTGIPGTIGGFSKERVLRAPVPGKLVWDCSLGDLVNKGQILGRVDGSPVTAVISGLLRGQIRPNGHVPQGLKLGDIDPRGDMAYLHTISDKGRAIGGAVLECIMRAYN
ncbi:selenium-dependent molybdenum cofactor biosynthesis protein YqeB [Desulfomicrobium escambiense]|uniref:selenium-dependent molybdenum cofactor biosynthesis protein YqeB n=1 Tax=Desulfomicrobium escambiense TaxID=29503 RepID=UPI0003FDEFFB|nr:selenium-dependent molybdenum cofactor biosynthesis protein YqeB [Desulfomicrobium escambiense]